MKPVTKPNPPAPRRKRGRPDCLDDDLAEAAQDTNCLSQLVANAERSAWMADDGGGTAEASEERNAAAEAQAMR